MRQRSLCQCMVTPKVTLPCISPHIIVLISYYFLHYMIVFLTFSDKMRVSYKVTSIKQISDTSQISQTAIMQCLPPSDTRLPIAGAPSLRPGPSDTRLPIAGAPACEDPGPSLLTHILPSLSLARRSISVLRSTSRAHPKISDIRKT
jgi:hypothetical protein